MNPRERGFLLLTCALGDPDRRPLTVAQLRQLAERIRRTEQPPGDRDMDVEDLLRLGYDRRAGEHILELLSGEGLLEYYLHRGERMGCRPVTRVSEGYPLLLRQRLGLDSPGCLWTLGDTGLLDRPAVALVGSRELDRENGLFAAEVGRQAAIQGYVLVSGNARGADRMAQEACLKAGGDVISVVADPLCGHRCREHVLYLSENGYDEEFSAQRALSRNRCIHALGTMTFVAQCRVKAGGTWDGTVKNLHRSWSRVYCFDDGSDASCLLQERGAQLIGIADLQSFYDLPAPAQDCLFGR